MVIEDGPQVILGAKLIDGRGGPPLDDAFVIVADGRIEAVGPQAQAPLVPGRPRLLDARGKTIIPGLVDMHVHIGAPADERLAVFVAAGVTTVLDLGGQIAPLRAWQAAIETGQKLGPRLYFSGPMLEEGEPFGPFAAMARRIDGPLSIGATVNQLADAGCNVIKLYVTIQPETARRATEAAHARGMRVFMHQQATWGAEAAEAGVDCLEHLMVFGDLAPPEQRPDAARMSPFEYGGWLWRWLPDLDLNAATVGRTIDRLVRAGAALDPTLVLFAARPAAVGLNGGDQSIDDPQSTLASQVFSPATLDNVRGRWMERREAGARASAASRERTRRAWANLLALVGRFHAEGGVVLAGTDCPNVAILPGFSLHRELELLTHAGLTPLQAITAATHAAASRLDRAHEFGSIAPGLSADLLILDADPLADIRNTRRIDRVMLRGRLLRPADVLAHR